MFLVAGQRGPRTRNQFREGKRRPRVEASRAGCDWRRRGMEREIEVVVRL